MALNNYADDASFPEDAAAASVLQSGHIAWICWRDPQREARERDAISGSA